MNSIKKALTDHIKSIGLHIDNYRGNIYGEHYASYVKNDGGVWQKPEELADLLLILENQNIRTFLNIGTFNGNTFNLIADHLHKSNNTVCITVDPFKHQIVKKIPYVYTTGTSDNFNEEIFDFVFIDGEHGYEWVKKDWENVGKYAKVVAFHDINDDDCPDVVRFWKELVSTVHNEYVIHELIEPTPNRNLMGIGVLVKK